MKESQRFLVYFYAPDIESTLCLPEDESVHCVRVKNKDDVIGVLTAKEPFSRSSLPMRIPSTPESILAMPDIGPFFYYHSLVPDQESRTGGWFLERPPKSYWRYCVFKISTSWNGRPLRRADGPYPGMPGRSLPMPKPCQTPGAV